MASNGITAYGSDPTTPNTTFVQADPSNFRAVVQKLTGASEDPSAPKLPLTLPSRLTTKPAATTTSPSRPTFKLHERRHTAKKLIIGIGEKPNFNTSSSSSSYSPYSRPRGGGGGFVGFGGEMAMASPVSTLEFLARRSPRTPRSPREEEERAIAEKGFYLHPSPRISEPPELLPLFPLHSPRDNEINSS
ncbi:VQ motif containing protein [Quillaja saponaria]|uniref:VQ motif containing protein n=1 Tax=Quillaja saponaria TaxID=32244 RepID=A0AAD7L635_QUISA|nr:VQ motif containing protein [Quillaja saponaria]